MPAPSSQAAAMPFAPDRDRGQAADGPEVSDITSGPVASIGKSWCQDTVRTGIGIILRALKSTN